MTDGHDGGEDWVSRRGFVYRTTAVTVTLAGCSGDGGGSQDGAETTTTTSTAATPTRSSRVAVEMNDNLEFVPESLTVATGTTVEWENVGTVGHSVTAYEEDIPNAAAYWASGGFDGESAARDGYPSQGDVGEGETYEHTFETAGTHEYFCIPHEGAGMVGEIVVE